MRPRTEPTEGHRIEEKDAHAATGGKRGRGVWGERMEVAAVSKRSRTTARTKTRAPLHARK